MIVADDRADVAVDVVGVADVEKAQRLTVAFLGPRDGEAGLAHHLGRAVDGGLGREADRRRLRLESCFSDQRSVLS